ncbi:hypothetical protein CFELI_03110 [Corynebacterium felinum]|uniref:Uncharacterized protein n=1 Tax=Corynebacterium felinum TaxID=131318 RepID=A0ABU2BBZ3_9CORY|nr:hypothetical protein [Corynebacterium felinum]WJY94264.1 hypothetical protein CFELI_03110 [Corynebacterium felinum]
MEKCFVPFELRIQGSSEERSRAKTRKTLVQNHSFNAIFSSQRSKNPPSFSPAPAPVPQRGKSMLAIPHYVLGENGKSSIHIKPCISPR